MLPKDILLDLVDAKLPFTLVVVRETPVRIAVNQDEDDRFILSLGPGRIEAGIATISHTLNALAWHDERTRPDPENLAPALEPGRTVRFDIVPDRVRAAVLGMAPSTRVTARTILAPGKPGTDALVEVMVEGRLSRLYGARIYEGLVMEDRRYSKHALPTALLKEIVERGAGVAWRGPPKAATLLDKRRRSGGMRRTRVA